MHNKFAQLMSLLTEKDVGDLETFDEVTSEAESDSDLLSNGAWRSAKSVVRKAIRLGISYAGHAKSELERLAKLHDDST